jgi:hypothetical protein
LNLVERIEKANILPGEIVEDVEILRAVLTESANA